MGDAGTGSILSRLAFVGGAVFCVTPFASPGLALALGLLVALALGTPFPRLLDKATRPLLQISVVLLGFGMNLHAILAAAGDGFALAAATIVLTFLLGALLGRVLALPRSISTLLSAGTAICGGSAIAAVALSIGAGQAEISVATGTVFILNAAALYLFPVIGHALHLSQAQFGTWSGIAIHDVSSVVGAASSYGPQALEVATAVKLSRTLWILPVAFIAGLVARRATAAWPALRGPIAIPWFIGLFLLASLAGSFVEPIHELAPDLHAIAKVGMRLTLLAIGASLSSASLKAVGARPVILGMALWLVISVVSLGAVRWLR